METEQKIKNKPKKGGKKSFYDVEAPITASKISLYGSSMDEFDGRVVILDLTKSLRGKNLELRMKIKYEEGKLIANPVSASLTGAFIRRSMRRGIDYVEESFKCDCVDAVVIVKPFLIARRRVSRSVRNVLRYTARNHIEAYLKVRSAKEIFSDIMTNKLQKGLALRLKKIYPLAMCEIRVFEVERYKEDSEIEKDEKKSRKKTEKLEIEEVAEDNTELKEESVEE